MKNYDKFKNMSVDEMAGIIQTIANCANCVASEFCEPNKECSESFKEWLEQEAE